MRQGATRVTPRNYPFKVHALLEELRKFSGLCFRTNRIIRVTILEYDIYAKGGYEQILTPPATEFKQSFHTAPED